MKDLNYYANKSNWPLDLVQAKEFAREAINTWVWKEKAPRFIAQIESATSVRRVQELTLYSLLSGEGLKVIK